MSVVVITPPEILIDREVAKAHLGVRHDDDDALIDLYIAAACAHIDGPMGWLGAALGSQTLELRLARFPACSWIDLPFGPATSIVSVTYLDSDGEDQVWPGPSYRLTDDRLAPVFGEAWPSGRADTNAVRIRWIAGHATPPAAIKAAVLMMVGDLYANRETTVIGPAAAVIPMSASVEALLSTFRAWRP